MCAAGVFSDKNRFTPLTAEFADADGGPASTRDVGALYGYASTLLNLCYLVQPTHVAACMDLGNKSSFRHLLYPGKIREQQGAGGGRAALDASELEGSEQQGPTTGADPAPAPAVEPKLTGSIRRNIELCGESWKNRFSAASLCCVDCNLLTAICLLRRAPFVCCVVLCSFGCSGYKIDRKPVEDSLKWQLRHLARVTRALGIQPLTAEGYEADDLIGTLAHAASSAPPAPSSSPSSDPAAPSASPPSPSSPPPFDRVIILSNDKDFIQCLNDRVSMLSPKNGSGAYVYMHCSDAREAVGVAPERFVEYLVLLGDVVDGIPGVPGIGPVRAKHILDTYKSLEHLIQDLKSACNHKQHNTTQHKTNNECVARCIHSLTLSVSLSALAVLMFAE